MCITVCAGACEPEGDPEVWVSVRLTPRCVSSVTSAVCPLLTPEVGVAVALYVISVSE